MTGVNVCPGLVEKGGGGEGGREGEEGRKEGRVLTARGKFNRILFYLPILVLFFLLLLFFLPLRLLSIMIMMIITIRLLILTFNIFLCSITSFALYFPYSTPISYE